MRIVAKGLCVRRRWDDEGVGLGSSDAEVSEKIDFSGVVVV